ncbi:hypothetical protein ACIBCT_18945 [Streptosporangium sp. NPDC050855]|uniref:hypothetical protein n=1 Tax=Streptosporangium sp. NPDC050855 TaxID=3366194 RepID=UPI00379D8DF6
MITASVAIGVFGAGAGLGTVVALRPDTGEGQVMRLAAGTYLLDDQAGAWTSSASPGGDQPLPLSGADAGSTISKGSAAGDAAGQRVCLTTTVDGHAVGTAAEGCVALPVLAAAAAAPLAQRPGNPKSTPAPPAKSSAPEKEKPKEKPKAAPAKPSAAPRSNAQAARRTSAPLQPAPDPAPVARPPVAPPVVNERPAKPAPTPTKKVSGDITQNEKQSEKESGSVIERPAETVVAPPKPAPETGGTRSSDPSRPSEPRPTADRPSQPRPGPTADRPSRPQPGPTADRPSQPTGDPQPQPRPTGDGRPSQPRPTTGDRPSQPGEGPRHSRPTGTLKPAIRSGPGGPVVPTGEVAPPETRPTDDARPPSRRARPGETAAPAPVPAPPTAEPAEPAEPGERSQERDPSGAQPSTGPGANTSQGPDGTVLMPATPRLPGGGPDGGVSLPIFEDPELLRRAHEALGLDRGMRYTDENGVWDLNIAPPGTPPCRDYTAEEIDALSSSRAEGAAKGRQAIPRDSCVWPAFVRWLYAAPAPGEVSNWTKFTGLPQRNLELVVTDPPPVPLPRPIPGGEEPLPAEPEQDVPGDSGNDREGAERSGQDEANPAPPAPDRQGQDRPDPAQPGPVQPDPGRPGPAEGQQARQDSGWNTGERGAPLPPDQGQVEPDPDEYDGR